MAVLEATDKYGLGIKLLKEERRDLTAACKERASATGMVKLAAFLTLVGLPAQTIGAGSVQGAKVMVLNAQDRQ